MAQPQYMIISGGPVRGEGRQDEGGGCRDRLGFAVDSEGYAEWAQGPWGSDQGWAQASEFLKAVGSGDGQAYAELCWLSAQRGVLERRGNVTDALSAHTDAEKALTVLCHSASSSLHQHPGKSGLIHPIDRITKAFTLRNQSTGYVKGCVSFAAIAATAFSEKTCFWLLVRVLEKRLSATLSHTHTFAGFEAVKLLLQAAGESSTSAPTSKTPAAATPSRLHAYLSEEMAVYDMLISSLFRGFLSESALPREVVVVVWYFLLHLCRRVQRKFPGAVADSRRAASEGLFEEIPAPGSRWPGGAQHADTSVPESPSWGPAPSDRAEENSSSVGSPETASSVARRLSRFEKFQQMFEKSRAAEKPTAGDHPDSHTGSPSQPNGSSASVLGDLAKGVPDSALHEAVFTLFISNLLLYFEPDLMGIGVGSIGGVGAEEEEEEEKTGKPQPDPSSSPAASPMGRALHRGATPHAAGGDMRVSLASASALSPTVRGSGASSPELLTPTSSKSRSGWRLEKRLSMSGGQMEGPNEWDDAPDDMQPSLQQHPSSRTARSCSPRGAGSCLLGSSQLSSSAAALCSGASLDLPMSWGDDCSEGRSYLDLAAPDGVLSDGEVEGGGGGGGGGGEEGVAGAAAGSASPRAAARREAQPNIPSRETVFGRLHHALSVTILKGDHLQNVFDLVEKGIDMQYGGRRGGEGGGGGGGGGAPTPQPHPAISIEPAVGEGGGADDTPIHTGAEQVEDNQSSSCRGGGAEGGGGATPAAGAAGAPCGASASPHPAAADTAKSGFDTTIVAPPPQPPAVQGARRCDGGAGVPSTTITTTTSSSASGSNPTRLAVPFVRPLSEIAQLRQRSLVEVERAFTVEKQLFLCATLPCPQLTDEVFFTRVVPLFASHVRRQLREAPEEEPRVSRSEFLSFMQRVGVDPTDSEMTELYDSAGGGHVDLLLSLILYRMHGGMQARVEAIVRLCIEREDTLVDEESFSRIITSPAWRSQGAPVTLCLPMFRQLATLRDGELRISASQLRELFYADLRTCIALAPVVSSSPVTRWIAPNDCKAVWVHDSSYSNCFVCSRHFWWYRRRHHCRSCGQLICSACSMKQRARVTGFKNPVRVCVACGEGVQSGIVRSFSAMSVIAEVV